jgi:DNA polymerase (family 10)
LTGSPRFNIWQRALAKRKGFRLNEYGLWRENEWIAGRTEREIFDILGMKYYHPQERE